MRSFFKPGMILGFMLLQCFLFTAFARDIIDMAGRHVSLPSSIKRIYTTTPAATLAVYVIKPDCLIAWNFVPNIPTGNARFFDPSIKDLPFGAPLLRFHPQHSFEEARGLKADLMLALVTSRTDVDVLEKQLDGSSLPVVFFRLDRLSDYIEAFTLLGEIVDKDVRAGELNAYLSHALSRVSDAVAKLPDYRHVHIYYDDGTELVSLKHPGDNQNRLLDPDFIVSHDSNFAQNINLYPRWSTIKAAAFGKVVNVPNRPFNWIDCPPSFMQALGMQWLANTFYPDAFPLDLKAETKRFYKLFLNIDMTDKDVGEILK